MSTPAPKATYNVVDNTMAVPELLNGVVFVQGITKRGPVKDPRQLIFSWPQFEQLFGGLMAESDFPLHCMILLNRGCILRVSSIKKDADQSSLIIKNLAEDALFTLVSKYPGEDYNELKAQISTPSDATLGDFNLTITFMGNQVGFYENLKADEVELTKALASSKWVELDSIEDLTLIVDPVPVSGTFDFVLGDDGDLVTDLEMSDFSAFDEYEDTYILSALSEGNMVIDTAGEAYASKRKDLRYYSSIPTSEDSGSIIALRIVRPYSKYISYTSGGWKIMDPRIGIIRNISEISHFIANAIDVIANQAPWFSFSGPGNPVPNVFGPVNNFGGKAKFTELDMLNRNHVNMAINRNGINMFWGNFTAQRENTHLKFISTHNLILYMAKSLMPVLETFIEKPLDLPLFKLIFYTVRPFLEKLVEGRAVFSADWLGDQEANSLSALKINNADDIQMGKYKVKCRITRINPLQDLELTIELTRAGITIE
jgi:hypothetical protein